MKPSHFQTPRTLSETSFVTGYVSIAPMAHRTPAWEKVAGVALAFFIGAALAACLFYGWSA